MGTRDTAKQAPRRRSEPPPYEKEKPRHKRPEPGKVPVTDRTKFEDVEQIIEHNPLTGRRKTR